ncbi:Dbl homology domain-containing protein [Gaertneriomyces semiglobifer]|nr:Dbl homology domain-containing protein [Gaertneriomyces semiglobifer]
MDDAIPSLPPPTLRSPLFSADTIVVMYPHLIDAIAGSLPSDAYEWNSQEIAPPVVSIKEKDSDAQSTMSKESKDDKESKHKDKKHKDEEKPKDTVQSVLQKDGRGHVVWNLIETERSYVSQLAVVQNYFRHKLLAEGILSETATNLIFAGIDELLVFHESFSAELETLVAPNSWNTSTTRIGALFIRHKDTLVRIYTRFIDSYAMSQKLMKREEKENPHYINFMKDALKHKETNRQQLKDFMILPVQRTARYHLLLKDLKNRTEESHPDFEDLHSAHEAMSALASAVNEKKRKEEEATGLFEAFEQTKNCPPTLIKHTRKLILNVDAVETLLNGKQKQIHLFLCSDLLMVTSVSGGRVLPFGRDKEQQRGFKFIRWLDLMEISVEYLGDTDKGEPAIWHQCLT